jgi:hypothetical protein
VPTTSTPQYVLEQFDRGIATGILAREQADVEGET